MTGSAQEPSRTGLSPEGAPDLSVLPAGTFAVISIIVGNICNELAPESDFQYFNHTTNESSVNTTALEAARLEISATLACLTAIIQVRALQGPCPTRRAKLALEEGSHLAG